MFNGNAIMKNVLPLALAGTALAAALASTSGFAGVEERMIENDPPRVEASETVIERKGPRGEVLFEQDKERDGDEISQLREGRIGLLPDGA
jgi:CRP-like cAMP-binding protein